MKVYKLTDKNNRTHGGYFFPLGIWREAPADGRLCGPGWLHCYDDALLAVLLNPIHGDYMDDARLWDAEAQGKTIDDRGLKRGVQRLRIVRAIERPEITISQRVRWAIYCAQEVCPDQRWQAWADKWLSGRDRSAESALAAWASPWAACAAAAAAEAAAESAESARAVAEAAAESARAAWIDLAALARRAIEEETEGGAA